MNYHHGFYLKRLKDTFGAEFHGMSDPVREAHLFRKTLELYPLHIEKNDLIAGWYGYTSREALESVYVPEPEPVLKSTREKRPVDWLRAHGYSPGGYDRAHHEVDYKSILTRGIDSYIQEVENELQNSENSEEKTEYLKGMLISLKGAERFSTRYAELAEELARNTDDGADKARLLRIAAACRKVPMKPPTDFLEAVQAAYLIRTLNCLSSYTCCSVSFGSFDQYMYPYYRVSKENGMTEDEAIAILLQLFRMLDNTSGNDCALSVGGVDENDNDATNELSYILIKAEKKSKLRAPLFTARINRNTPKEFMRELVSKELFEMGQPSFYSEENCRAAVAGRGIEPSVARNFQISTCMNLVIANAEAAHGWGCKVNCHLPLELALNGGKPLVGELPLEFKTKPRTEYKSIDEIYTQYRSYMIELFDIAMDWNQADTVLQAKHQPNAWLSALTDDCIKRGKDRWDGGARYHNLIIEMMGFANTSDAITAIDRLVFEQGKYTIDDFIKAAQANYEGYEQLHKDILHCDKYGMNIDRADRNARRLLDINAEICEAKSAENRRYLPSLHTLWEDVLWAKGRPAFLDGRLSGEPVNKNAGPSTSARRAGPTCTAISACKINQIRYSGGQALDVHIGIRNMDSIANRDKIAAYIQTYFKMGGLQLQVNGLSVETLQKAYDAPQEYSDLLVRIGGHSRYFRDFDDNMKKKFIERFKIEEGAFG